MARRVLLDLMNVGVTQTGNGDWFDYHGGEGVFVVDAKSGGGAINLQMQSPSGNAFNITDTATSDIAITAAGKSANFRAPAGKMRAAAGAETDVVCYVVGVPQNVAG